METLVTFGRLLGFSLAAGVNLYATVAILGLASRYGWVALPAGPRPRRRLARDHGRIRGCHSPCGPAAFQAT
jgi:hypothetical protein